MEARKNAAALHHPDSATKRTVEEGLDGDDGTGLPPPSSEAQLRGMGLMTLGMAMFAVGDGFVKGSAGAMAPGGIILTFGTGGVVVFGLLNLAVGGGLKPHRFFEVSTCRPGAAVN